MAHDRKLLKEHSGQHVKGPCGCLPPPPRPPPASVESLRFSCSVVTQSRAQQERGVAAGTGRLWSEPRDSQRGDGSCIGRRWVTFKGDIMFNVLLH